MESVNILRAGLVLIWVSCVINVRWSAAVWLSMPATGMKCMSEEVQNNVVVMVDYAVMADHHVNSTPTVSSKLTSPYGNIIYRKGNTTHDQIAFTSTEAGSYLACFWLDGHTRTTGRGEISLVFYWKTGIAAKDWESLAKKENIQGVELELMKLEGAVESIHENMLYLKTREAELLAVSENTNARVAWYGFMSLGVCIAASAAQASFLTQYFQQKKLI